MDSKSMSMLNLISHPLIKFWILLGWFYGLIWFVWLSTPFTGFVYYFRLWVSYYDYSHGSATQFTIAMAGCYSYVMFCLTPVWYLWLLLILKRVSRESVSGRN